MLKIIFRICFVSALSFIFILNIKTEVSSKELVFATKVGAPSLDPYNEISDARMRRSPLIYDCLFEWTNDFGIKPALAKKWEYTGNTLKINLRDDVLFHDGSRLTSADVFYSLNKILESPGKGFYSQIKKVNVIDKYRINIEVTTPSDALLAALGGRYAYIVKKGAVEESNLAISANGTGPFKVEEFRQGEYLSLIKNNNYWNNKKANIDKLKIVIMPDEASIVAGLKSGQIHATIFEDARIAELLKRSSNINVFEKVAARWDILDFPALDQSPWNNKKFRQAIVAAIDNEAIMNLAINGKGTLIGGHPKALWASLAYEDAPYAKRNITLAKRLLSESGFDTSQTIKLISIQGYSALNSGAEVIVDQLKDIGLNVEIEILELGTWIDKFLKRTFDTFTMNSWGGWIDPDQLYFNHFHKKPIGKDFRRWNNDKISEMLNSARNSVNRSERTKIYLEIQNFLAEEVPWYPLYSANFVGAHRQEVSNFSVHPSGHYHDLRWISLK